jgi:hypothetical protein
MRGGDTVGDPKFRQMLNDEKFLRRPAERAMCENLLAWESIGRRSRSRHSRPVQMAPSPSRRAERRKIQGNRRPGLSTEFGRGDRPTEPWENGVSYARFSCREYPRSLRAMRSSQLEQCSKYCEGNIGRRCESSCFDTEISRGRSSYEIRGDVTTLWHRIIAC